VYALSKEPDTSCALIEDAYEYKLTIHIAMLYDFLWLFLNTLSVPIG
jgi:hypothetical protein